MSFEPNDHGPDSRPQRPMFDQQAAPGTDEAAKPDETVKSGVSEEPAGEAEARPAAGKKGDAERIRYVSRAAGEGGEKKDEADASAALHARKRRRKKNRRMVISIVALALVAVLLGGGFAAWNIYKGIMETIQPEEVRADSVPDEIKTEALPEYKGKGIVAGLVCGIDYNNDGADGYVDENDKVGNTDMIMYVMFDTVNDTAKIMQIPRDTFVGTEVQAGAACKLNGVYAMANDPTKRMQALTQVIYDQLRLPVDFYITLDMDALKAIVDHMGYITVYVPEAITDKDTGDILVYPDWQNITSESVEILVRNRNYVDQDISRLRTQQYFYSALFREFKELSPYDLVMWMRILVYYAKIGGLDVVQIGGLAQEALNVKGSDITFVRPAVTGAFYDNPSDGRQYEVVCLVPDEMADLLNEHFRPEGTVVPAEDLDIHTLPVNYVGKSEAEVKTMGDIQATEPPQAA